MASAVNVKTVSFAQETDLLGVVVNQTVSQFKQFFIAEEYDKAVGVLGIALKNRLVANQLRAISPFESFCTMFIEDASYDKIEVIILFDLLRSLGLQTPFLLLCAAACQLGRGQIKKATDLIMHELPSFSKEPVAQLIDDYVMIERTSGRKKVALILVDLGNHHDGLQKVLAAATKPSSSGGSGAAAVFSAAQLHGQHIQTAINALASEKKKA